MERRCGYIVRCYASKSLLLFSAEVLDDCAVVGCRADASQPRLKFRHNFVRGGKRQIAGILDLGAGIGAQGW